MARNRTPLVGTDRLRITFGYNKDHRPDLKQLLYSITISADGAVPLHCKLYDGNTTDDAVHIDTWLFLRQLVGHSDFLYVADSKLCSRDNMSFIDSRQGRFLTIMPRTRNEDNWFRNHVQTHDLEWREVHREPHPRRQDAPDVVYHAVESPQRSSEGYRLLWYRSSQKEELDRQSRWLRLQRAQRGRRDCAVVAEVRALAVRPTVQQAAERVVSAEQVERWLRIVVEEEVIADFRQSRPGRPGPETEYRRVESRHYRVRLEEDTEALRREGRCDGLFPLLTNDETLSLAEALAKYKYQPFVEKRHEELKSVFAVTPMWLKNVGRVESLLWLYYVVEMVSALVERELRRRMAAEGLTSVALYPEGRGSSAPTAGLVLSVLEGLRRHRLLNEQGQELRRFHDTLPDATQEALRLLGIETEPYGRV